MHQRKVLLSLVMAALGMSMCFAGAVQAAPLFHFETAPATVKGEGTEASTFTLSGGTLKCTTSAYEGTVSTTTTTTLSATAAYSGCKLFGFFIVTINMNGCSFTFHLIEGSEPAKGTGDIVCPAGKEIQVSSGAGCTISFEPITGLPATSWQNTGTGSSRDLDESREWTGVKYTESAGCPLPGTHSNGTYKTTTTWKAVGQGTWVQ